MKAFVIGTESIAKCPDHSWQASHYREDGSCYHYDPDGRGPLSPAGVAALEQYRRTKVVVTRLQRSRQLLSSATDAMPDSDILAFQGLVNEIESRS